MYNDENKTREQLLVEKKEKKNQQRITRLSGKFPSQEELFNFMVVNALKPNNKRF
jgi:hypothetical protein